MKERTILGLIAGVLTTSTALIGVAHLGNGGSGPEPLPVLGMHAEAAEVTRDRRTPAPSDDELDGAMAQPPAAPGGEVDRPDGGTESRDLMPVIRGELRGCVSPLAFELTGEAFRRGFEQCVETVDLEFDTQAERNAIEMVLAGTAEFALITIEPSSTERGYGITERNLGWFLPAVTTHPDNPVRSLSKHALRRILTGDTDSWSSFGWDDARIEVAQLVPGQLGSQLQSSLLQGDRIVQGPVLMEPRGVVDYVQGQRWAVGLSSLAALREGQQAMMVDGFPPSVASYRMGQYPFGCTLRLIYKGMPSAELNVLLAFLSSSEGQAELGRTLTLR